MNATENMRRLMDAIGREQDPFILACREVAAQDRMLLESTVLTEGALMDRIRKIAGKIAGKIRGHEAGAIARAQEVFADGTAPAAQGVLSRIADMARKASNPRMLLVLASMAGALVSLHANPAQAQQGAEAMDRALGSVIAPGHDGRTASQGLQDLVAALHRFDAQNPGALSAPRAAPAQRAAPNRPPRPEPTRDQLGAWAGALGITPPARR